MKSRWLLIAVLALAACQPAASDSPSPSEGAPSEAPASMTEAATGTITIVEGGVVDGPGLGISEALDTAGAEPVLVNGILLKDVDGAIWLCESITDASPRTCAGAYLSVENYPADAPEFDPANSGDTGSQEEDGVVWLEDQQLYGTVVAD